MDNRPAGKGNGLEECSLVKELEEGSGFDDVSEWCHRHSHHGEGKTMKPHPQIYPASYLGTDENLHKWSRKMRTLRTSGGTVADMGLPRLP